MGYPDLCRGSSGEEVKTLQLFLNRAGAMLQVDGDFGRATEVGVRYVQDIANMPLTGSVNSTLWKWVEKLPDPFPPLATNGVAFIAHEETGGLDYYEAITRWPHYPGESSGITIGVGFDLRFNSEGEFRSLWSDHLPAGVMGELSKDIGKRGTKKRSDELRRMGIFVPFKSAWPVFIKKTLPQFYSKTESIYPSLGELPEMCRAVLVSIVYNRGTDLTGDRRREMREIRDLLAKAQGSGLDRQKKKEILQGVEDSIVSMKRLWGPSSGLYVRRQSEANLWRSGLDSW
jgi:hypothetical protein